MARPQFVPTQDQREMVRTLSAVCINHEGIARKIGLRSVKTLRKHFSKELELGLLDATAQVSQTHLIMAKSGHNLKATLSWSKRYGRRWTVAPTVEVRPLAIPDFVVAEDKEAA
jgi:hypothetical protein